jgi:hypothetical protein
MVVQHCRAHSWGGAAAGELVSLAVDHHLDADRLDSAGNRQTPERGLQARQVDQQAALSTRYLDGRGRSGAAAADGS